MQIADCERKPNRAKIKNTIGIILNFHLFFIKRSGDDRIANKNENQTKYPMYRQIK